MAKEIEKLIVPCGEMIIDASLDEGLARDIPILRTIIALARVSSNIKDVLFLNKIADFLNEVDSTSQEDRDKFAEKVTKKDERFQEAVLLILEQSDRVEKSPLIGKIFKTCILGFIPLHEAFCLSHMVNRAFWYDLDLLLSKDELSVDEQFINRHVDGIPVENLGRLHIAGFYDIADLGSWDEEKAKSKCPGLKYYRNDYGNIIYLIAKEDYEGIRDNKICYNYLNGE